jgi:hypothetical protein
MNPNPMKKYREPRYPTRLRAAANPKLLSDNLPPAWRGSKELAAAVLIAVVGINCKAQNQPMGKTGGKVPEMALVLPIFDHGVGRGFTGGLGPIPRFLSEEEGVQIISEELAKAGIKLNGRNVDLPEIKIIPLQESKDCGPAKKPISWNEDPEIMACEIPDQAQPLNIDAFNPDKKIAIEFVSDADYFNLGAPRHPLSSTVQYNDFKKVAQGLAAQVEKQGKGLYFGAFYEPMWDDHPGGGLTTKDLLRLQVQDFVQWLKAQGAI